MSKQLKKYSKISPALKCCFLSNIYYHRFTIKEVFFILSRLQIDAR